MPCLLSAGLPPSLADAASCAVPIGKRIDFGTQKVFNRASLTMENVDFKDLCHTMRL